MVVYEIFDGAVSTEVIGHKKKVHCVAWNLSGSRLASGSVDQSTRVWDVEHGSRPGKELELKGHSDSVDQVCWDPTSAERLVTVSGDKTLRAWDVRSGSKCVATVNTSGENINLAWHPDGSIVAVSDRDDVVSFVDTRKHRVIGTQKFPLELNEMCWSPSGGVLWVTTGLGTVEVHSWPLSRRLLSIKAHAAGCYAIDIDPSGQRVALGGADTLVSLWDAVDYTCLHTVTRLDKPVRAVRFSKGGDFIATGSEENFIDISDAQTGECAVRLLAGAAPDSLAWSPTEYIIAYVGDAQPANIDKYARTAVKIWGVPSTRMV